MAGKTSIEMLFNHVENNKFNLAYKIQHDARSEYNKIYQRINLDTRSKIGFVNEFIIAVEKHQEKGAVAKRNGAKIDFDSHIRPFLEEEQRSQHSRSSHNNGSHHSTINRDYVNQPSILPNQQQGTNRQHNQKKESTHGQTQITDASAGHDNGHTPLPIDINTSVSGQASRSLRANNPNIADLSDTNRPTKTAERFSELYDNQWTDAFEESHAIKTTKDEKDVVEFLIKIVKDAYARNQEVANKQIAQMAACALSIVATGQVGSSSTVQPSQNQDANLLVQFRKQLAPTAVKRLQEKFLKGLQDNRNKKDGTKLKAFADKCVELTWWMCVQDPPIYMDDDKDERMHNPEHYKAYTRSGTKIDYIVWPALLLHEGGAVLMKGVAQYKKK